MSRVWHIENVINYVIKLPMQKQIPTLLQALRKQLYEMPAANTVGIWHVKPLTGELLFKTKWSNLAKRGQRRACGGNDE